jgi:predicted deacylase
MWKDMTVINVRRGGLFYPKVKHADVVSKGQNLGSVKNLRGEVVEEIASTKDGIVMIMYPRHVVNTGDVVFNIATDIEEHVRVT